VSVSDWICAGGVKGRTEVQQVEALTQPLLVLQRAFGGALLAVGRMLSPRVGGLATGRYGLRHPSQLCRDDGYFSKDVQCVDQARAR